MKLYVVEIRKSSVNWCGYATHEEIYKMMKDPENAFYDEADKTIVFDNLEEAKQYLRLRDLWFNELEYTHHKMEYEVISLEEVEKEEYKDDPVMCDKHMIDYKIPDPQEDR